MQDCCGTSCTGVGRSCQLPPTHTPLANVLSPSAIIGGTTSWTTGTSSGKYSLIGMALVVYTLSARLELEGPTPDDDDDDDGSVDGGRDGVSNPRPAEGFGDAAGGNTEGATGRGRIFEANRA